MATLQATADGWKYPEFVNRYHHAHDAYSTAVWEGIFDRVKYKPMEETCLCLCKVKAV